MAAGQEVGVVYVHVEPSASGFSANLDRELATTGTTVDKRAGGWGKTIAGKVGGALSTVGKLGLGAITAVGGGLAAMAAKGGWDRALKVEAAQQKLKALHMDTNQVASAMDSALKAVKGTAFGMDAAANVASALAAAGVNLGDDMTRSLNAVADAAAVAGGDMEAVGQIFAKAAASGKVQGDTLQQLADNGIPATAALAKSMGKTQAEISDLASKGKISFKDLTDAIQTYMGGAAKSMGETTTGAIANFKAALSRLGQGFQTTNLNSLKDILNALTPLVDTVAAKLQPFADRFSELSAPAVGTAVSYIERFTAGLESGSITLADVAANIGKLAGGFTLLAGVGGNIGDLAGFIDTLSNGVSSANRRVSTGVAELASNLRNGMSDGVGALTDGAKTIGAGCKKVGEQVGKLGSTTLSHMGGFGEAISKGIGSANTKASVAAGKLSTGIQSALANTKNNISTTVSGWGEAIAGRFGSVMPVTTTRVQGLFNKGIREALIMDGDPFASMTQQVQNSCNGLLGKLSPMFNSLGGKLTAGLQGTFNALGTFFSPAAMTKLFGFGSIAAALLAGIGLLDSSMGGGLRDMVTRLSAELPGMIAALAQAVTSQAASFVTAGTALVSTLLDTITQNLPALLQLAGDLIVQLCNGLQTALPTLIPQAAQIVTTLVTGLLEQIPQLVTAAMSVLQGLAQGLTAALPVLIAAVPQIVMALMTALAEALPTIISAGANILNALIEGITTALPLLLEMLPTLIQNMSTVLITNLPLIVDAGIRLLNSLTEGIINALPQLLAYLPQIISSTVQVLTANLPRIVSAGIQLLVSLITGIINALPRLVSYLPQIIATTVSVIMQNLPAVINAGVQVLVALINGLCRAIPQLVASLPQVINAIKSGFSNVNWGELGANIVNGIKNGLMSLAGSLWDAACNLAKGALDRAKSFLGIHSPSRVFRDQVGKNVALGMALGIERNTGAVVDASDAMAEAALPHLDTLPELDTSAWFRSIATAKNGLHELYTPLDGVQMDGMQTVTVAGMGDLTDAVGELMRRLPGYIADYTPTIGSRELSRMVR